MRGSINDGNLRYVSHSTVPRQCNLYKSVPDTLLYFAVCNSECCILSHPVPHLHFRKINPNFSGSVTYVPHHAKPPISSGLLYMLQPKYTHFVKVSHSLEVNGNNF